MLSKKYIESHDIDWFCIINGIFVHVASDGGALPNLQRFWHLRELQLFVAHLPVKHKYEISPEIYVNKDNDLENLTEDNFKKVFPEAEDIPSFGQYSNNTSKAYLWSFINMARRGFYSFDRVGTNDNGVDMYSLVAWPTDEVENLDLPTKDQISVKIASKDFDLQRLESGARINLVEMINLTVNICRSYYKRYWQSRALICCRKLIHKKRN